MNRTRTTVVAILAGAAAQVACGSPTAALGPCETSSTAFSAVPSAFVAVVTKVDYEHATAPGGSQVSNYLLELTILSPADSLVGLFVKRGTPIFARSAAGTHTVVTACAIEVGTIVEIWHDSSIATSSGTPPPNTWYYGTQLVIVR
jgi:hypothetical protein